MKTTHDLTSEAELCDALAAVAPSDGWDVFPEVAGFDLVLVWNGSRPAPSANRYDGTQIAAIDVGFQLGIDAKLRANIDVLDQCAGRVEDSDRRPDAAAVLVPVASREFCRVAHRIGLRVLELRHCRSTPEEYSVRPRTRIEPCPVGPLWLYRGIASPAPGRLAMPPVPLQGSGGRASPRVLSPWRVGALRVVLMLDRAGKITRAEAKPFGIDLSDWATRGWLATDGGRPATYTKGHRWDSHGPHVGYEQERDAIAAHMP